MADLFAIALQEQPRRIKGACLGIDLSSVLSTPSDEFVGIDEHPFDVHALFGECLEFSLQPGSPLVIGRIDVIEDFPKARVILGLEPKCADGFRCHIGFLRAGLNNCTMAELPSVGNCARQGGAE